MKKQPEPQLPKKPYEPPRLEQHLEWKVATTGIVSVPVGVGQD
jgi:hypothetical protein